MNILLIGGDGFIGSNLARQLKKEGHNLFFIDKAHQETDQAAFFIRRNGITSTENSLPLNIDNLASFLSFNIDYCIHAASGLLPSSGIKTFLIETKALIGPTYELIKLCSLSKTVFVYISSGGSIYQDSDRLISENSLLAPQTFYGMSKVIIEKLIVDQASEGLKYLILRPTNIYGRNLENIKKTQGLTENAVEKILNNQEIPVYGNGTFLRDYLYIDDFVSIILTLIRQKILNEIFNVGSGELISINDRIDQISKILQIKPKIKKLPARKFDKKIISLDIDKLQKILPFTCYSSMDGINKYIQTIDKQID